MKTETDANNSIEGRETEVQLLSMEFRKTMFDSAYEYLRKQGTHARPDITKHDFLCGYLQCHNDHFKPVGNLEEKETPEQFYARGRYPEMKDKFDKSAARFSYDDMMQFADDYTEAVKRGSL